MVDVDHCMSCCLVCASHAHNAAQVPAFALFKVASFVIPYVLPAAGRMRDAMSSQPSDSTDGGESKRQQKLRQRQSKGAQGGRRR